MLKEGGKVIYAGEDLTIGQGSLGRVLVVAGTCAHVQWLDGPKTGLFDLVDDYDLSVPEHTASAREVVASQFDQSLEMTTTAALMVREAMDTYGEDGVLTALAEQGQLAMLERYATEAIEHLAGALRTDPSLAELLAPLDDYEQEQVLARLASSLLDAEDEES